MAGGSIMTKFAQSEWPLRGVLSALLLSPFLAGAATPGNDATATRAEGAFLLGLDLADYTEDMKIVAVALQGNKFTIDTNVDLTKVRGRLYVLVADSPADIVRSVTSPTWSISTHPRQRSSSRSGSTMRLVIELV